jgi:glycosyltransferase involved in cell wall biosynthesis
VRRWRQPKNRVCYLPNGVDLERFRPAPAPAPEPVGRHAPEGRPVVIGHVAHLRPEKNQRLLLAAMARMTWRAATVLRIVGDGPEAGRLRTTVDQLGITQQVEFVGKVADTAPVYRDFDLFVLSSDTEQMPLTVLEAMASGLPVVSTDVGDVRSMVHATNRQFITPKGDVAALAGALDHLVTDAATRRTLGEHNRVHCAQHFDKAACYRAWVELYAGYLRTHPA